MSDWESIPPFPENISSAPIETVDYDGVREGDASALESILEASRGIGFFYLKNHHIDEGCMFDLANDIFQLPMDEKLKYDMGIEGRYFGYKHSGANVVDARGTPDRSEFYMISKDDILAVGSRKPLTHPAIINARKQQVTQFMRSSHAVCMVILAAYESALGLPPDTLTELHRLDRPGGDQARLTHAAPLCDPQTIALGEHTDYGSVTVLFNRLGGLQALDPDDRLWKYVKPKEGFAIFNFGDALVKLLGRRMYSGLHRVMAPPGEQVDSPRHSVVYFCRPNGDLPLKPLLDDEEPNDDVLTADEWIKRRVMLNQKATFKGKETIEAKKRMEHTKGRDARVAPVIASEA